MKSFIRYLQEARTKSIKIVVFRLGSKNTELSRKNAGNIEGVISHMDRIDDRGIGGGDHITALEVEVFGNNPWGKYEQFAGNAKPKHEFDPDGERVGTSPENNKAGSGSWKKIWYSFPPNGNWRVIKKIKSVSLKQLDKEVAKLKVLIWPEDPSKKQVYNWLGGLSWVDQKKIIQKAFKIK